MEAFLGNLRIAIVLMQCGFYFANYFVRSFPSSFGQPGQFLRYQYYIDTGFSRELNAVSGSKFESLTGQNTFQLLIGTALHQGTTFCEVSWLDSMLLLAIVSLGVCLQASSETSNWPRLLRSLRYDQARLSQGNCSKSKGFIRAGNLIERL